MPQFRRFLTRRWLLAFVSAAVLVFGLLMLHPYPRQSLFGPTIRGKPWCVWEAEVRRYVYKQEFEQSRWTRILSWLGIHQDVLEEEELFGDEAKVPLLVHLLDDSDPKIRHRCLCAFRSFDALQQENALPAIYERLHDGDKCNQLMAAMTIWWMKKDKSVIPQVFRLMDQDADSWASFNAARLFCNSDICVEAPEVFPEVERRVLNHRLYIRRHLFPGLAKFGMKAVPTLMKALTDPDDWVRFCAASTLDKLGVRCKEAVPVLTEVLTHSGPIDPSWDTRLDAAEMLGRIGPDAIASLPVLTKLATHEDADLRSAAVDALVGIDPQRFQHLMAERKID